MSSARRWFRPTIGRLMASIVVVALAVVWLAGIDPLRRAPMRQALDRAVGFCATATYTFDPVAAPPEPTRVATSPPTLQPPIVAAPCVLKFDHGGQVIVTRRGIATFGIRGALGEHGGFQTESNSLHSVGGGRSAHSATEIRAIRALLAALPPSDPEIPDGPSDTGIFISGSIERRRRIRSRIFALGYRDRGTWVTRTYDTEHLPRPVVDLCRILGYQADDGTSYRSPNPFPRPGASP